MNFDELITKMNPVMHEALRRAVEIGKWPDGRSLAEEEREICMAALIAYEGKRLPEDQRTGFIDTKRLAKELCDDDIESEIKWQ